jgi:MFS family permease
MTVLMTSIANWFRKNLGIASGIVLSGVGFGGLLIPVVVKLIDLHGWRLTMIILSLGMIALILPLSLVFRHKPEQYGYLPDGSSIEKMGHNKVRLMPQDAEIGRLKAIKTRTFWHLGFSFMYHMFVTQAIFTHIMPYLSSIGIARTTSSILATSALLTSVIGRLGFGWLADRINRKLVSTCAFAMMVLGTLCFNYITVADAWLLVPFCILFGIGYGGINTMRPSLVIEFFGRANFGTFFGLIIGIAMLGSIIGPLLAGWAFDNWGSYQGVWLIFAGVGAVAVILIASTPPVHSEVHSQ